MQLPNCLCHLSALVFSMVVGFILSWRLALASLPFVFLFVGPVLGMGALLKGLGMKMKGAYDKGGGVADQAISSIRTVYSYVGEQQTIDKFSNALETSMRLGIKQGFTKGLMIGSMGMVFVTWAFVAWVGSYLVTQKGETGGPVFVSAICVIMAGL
ncbi:putative ABC-type xenobiotic transporter [Helianthus annuus]|uniref:ABC-type xenobiotic transporter n=1 Tax=Helianthus annuus TaxID=4232 RepID=A0A9K3NB13_HELAN|nr:putative ABC-type xenobiotic transporter [Helianthus annuus]KAJ0537352.1 putative ABC-type xenobiotic transporter [Helianthus annuus]KAJ0551932.1 putative ABC-type xenobiotic transporter [Helianthus annuus]KAJ0717634.1 putative ABC-type xenobiotic transporter [Helianthus annuus]KAJ0720851.1 putative ABC-type xenobiotic transporter [Helianthus annuus]